MEHYEEILSVQREFINHSLLLFQLLREAAVLEKMRVESCIKLEEEEKEVSGADSHTVCTFRSCRRGCRQHGLWHEVLRKGTDRAQEQVLWQNDVEKAAQHLASEVSNLVKLQPADINNLQLMSCYCCSWAFAGKKHETSSLPRQDTGRT